MDFQILVDAYKASDEYMSVSNGTKVAYASLINRLSAVKNIPEIENAMHMPVAVALARSRSHLDFWSSYIRSLPISANEKNRTRGMLKSVYSASCLGHLVATIKMESHTKVRSAPLRVAQVEAVWNNKSLNRKYACLLRFAFYSGMRPSEVRALKWSDVGEFITVVGSKGREKGVPSRMVPASQQLKECLVWCRENCRGEYVFSGSLGKPLNKDVVCSQMAALRSAAGIEGVLYDARRGIATELARAKVDIRSIRDLLGHRDIKTTEAYISMGMEEKALGVGQIMKEVLV